jgi:hypothetical protein
MSEITKYSDAVSLAKSILHGPCDETMVDAGRIIRFMASQETEDVPKLLAEIERLNKVIKYVNDLSEDFYTEVNEDNSLSIPNTERHKHTMQEIFVVTIEAVNNDD